MAWSFQLKSGMGLSGQVDTASTPHYENIVPVNVKYSNYSSVFKIWNKITANIVRRRSIVKKLGLVGLVWNFLDLQLESVPLFIKGAPTFR
ncbi:MAG: hypothetical protein HXS52_00765 [Theionarchaea archaeon]|nr:hypothetical protein [Theionarchaea archaeon]